MIVEQLVGQTHQGYDRRLLFVRVRVDLMDELEKTLGVTSIPGAKSDNY